MLSKIITYIIGLVWLVNGLYCKILNQVPRHQEIVTCILGESYRPLFIILIGCSEVAMFLWIVSRIKTRINAILQITIIATMNIMEFLIVPDLLLWGKYNSLFAFLFIVLIYVNEFHLRKEQNPVQHVF